MTGGPTLTFVAIFLQSVGEVLYGTFLHDVPASLFVFLSVCQTALVFLAFSRFRLPREGRALMLQANIWTAICFVSFFFALKHLPPAICTSIEIGMSLFVAVAVTCVQGRAWPRSMRVLACVGIVVGCGFLSWAEIMALMPEASSTLVWSAIAASSATGTASALFATTSKQLSAKGWTSGNVLAHRFYLTIAAALVWLSLDGVSGGVSGPLPSGFMLVAVSAVGAVAVLVPLLLFQIALRRLDALTFMICTAAQPVLSFFVSAASPRYGWDWLTMAGVLVVTLFVGLDILARHRVQRAAPAAPSCA